MDWESMSLLDYWKAQAIGVFAIVAIALLGSWIESRIKQWRYKREQRGSNHV